MKTTKVLQLITAILEGILAVPILGGLLVISTLWTILGVALVLHIVTLVIASREGYSFSGSIVGVIASVLGWIPVVGWGLHTAAAITLLVNFVSKK
ncbi:MAG: hypothetical protein LAT82_00335 [Nanoarchaeota archaeon]|nr:hypothetical protein [Nanoarchaeota archaeon]